MINTNHRKISKIAFVVLIFNFTVLNLCPAQEINIEREQSQAEAVALEESKSAESIPKISNALRKYYLKIILRDILTENDCKILIDLNETLALIQKVYKERRYDKAKNLLKVIFDDITKIKEEAGRRINENLKQGKTTADFKNIYRQAKKRRYPAICAYHHLQDIENDAKVYKKDTAKAVFSQEVKLLDKEREAKMREHIEKALLFLKEEKYYEAKAEFKQALELCTVFETKKIIKQRIREVDQAIKQAKKQKSLRKKK